MHHTRSGISVAVSLRWSKLVLNHICRCINRCKKEWSLSDTNITQESHELDFGYIYQVEVTCARAKIT